MNIIAAWAQRYQIHPAAVQELYSILGCAVPPAALAPGPYSSEAGVQSAVRLRAAQLGNALWRNNSGATADETGRVIRFGLGNDSAQTNRVFKSSDLIGITRRPACGCGVFTAYEVKRPGWKYAGTEREQGQFNFIKKVISLGGIAKFITNVEEIVP